MSEFRTKPNPDQPDRCPSIDPHDELQCARRIHEDDQCQCGGIGWKKGTPRYISDREKVASCRAVLAERERELLTLKGPCSNRDCRLHYAHSGPCDTRHTSPVKGTS